ncbi:glycoside hydrolase superfamily [Aspergillus nidulans var. acristatus]
MRVHTLTWLLSLSFACIVTATAPVLRNATVTRGIDLFEIHLPVNWKTAVAEGVEFVFVKSTEGIAYRNLRFKSQTGSAAAVSISSNTTILHGAVHFALASQSTGAAQADFFISHGGNWAADGATLPGVLEMEGNIPGKLCHGMSPTEITDWMVDFSDRYKEVTGRRPILFLSAGWWEKCAGNNETFAQEHPLWLANWADEMGDLPAGWEEATFWQYSGSAGDGVSGEGDVYFGDKRELVRFAKASV